MNIKRPSIYLHLTELWRAFREYRIGKKFVQSWSPLQKGNEEPVLVIPGLTASPWSTKLLRNFLSSENFTAYDWGLGRNLGNLKDLTELEKTLALIHKKHDRKVIIIGWSLGGIYARRLGQSQSNLIEKVITLGSPYRAIRSPNYAAWFFNLLQRFRGGVAEPKWVESLDEPLNVPSIAYYSKKDGIVPWEACHDPDDSSDHVNIEVRTSHFGMGASKEVLQSLVQELYR